MNPREATSHRPGVLVATVSVGAGHNAVAQAVLESLRSADAALDVRCVDVLGFTGKLFRTYYAGGFALAMTRFPRLYGLGFRLTNRPQSPSRGLRERRRLWSERRALRRFERYLLQTRPGLIINTHFLAAPLIGRMIRAGRLDTQQMVVVTDIEAHRFWYAENVTRWFVPNAYTAGLLRRWGIGAEQIIVSGVPIHRKWTQPRDREKIFADWRLPPERKIVLLTGGTEFTCGPIMKIARRILAGCQEACVVVLAGRNKKLLGRLSVLPESPQRLVGVGLTDRIHELVEVCSLMVTKAGGIITAECLSKGTPMVLLKPVPGHEAGNAAYFAREGAAVVARGTKDVAQTVARLLADPQAMERLADNARRLYKPGTQTVTAAVTQALSLQSQAPTRKSRRGT